MEHINQRVSLTKRMLKDAVLRLAEKKDVDKITVAELCREADINRATFYRHYQIPRDVLMELQREMFYELYHSIQFPKTLKEIYPALLKLCTYLQSHEQVLRIMIRSNSDTDFMNFVNEMYMECWKVFEEIPILKNLSTDDIRLLVQYSAGGSYFVLRQWVMGNYGLTPEEMADGLYSLLQKPDWMELRNQIEAME